MNPRNGASGQSCTYVSADGLNLHYADYDGGDGVTALCLHGLTRNGRDFADLATHLQASRWVVCPDFRGRGLSEWDPDPTHYEAPVYVQDTLTLIDHIGLERIVIIGTSLGGIVGAGLVQANSDLFAGIVLNDIGPVIDPAGLTRIGGNTGHDPQWPDWETAAEELKAVHKVVHPNYSDEDWLKYAHRTCRINEDGVVVQDYDPAIARAFAEGDSEQQDLWPLFEVSKPVPALLVRGALSDLLSEETAAEMAQKLPNLARVNIPDCGHVPTLTEPEALSAIETFFDRVDTEEKRNS